MGCDIHQRTFLWSKTIRRYVGTEEVCDYGSEYDIAEDRYYDYFGLFGNNIRSSYPPLDEINWGLPDFLPKTAKASFKHYGMDYHTFSWFLLPNLCRSMQRYIDKLKNPGKFIIDDPESIDAKFFDLPEWKEDTTQLISYIQKKVDHLKWIVEDRNFEKIIDPDKTLILIYFDN